MCADVKAVMGLRVEKICWIPALMIAGTSDVSGQLRTVFEGTGCLYSAEWHARLCALFDEHCHTPKGRLLPNIGLLY